MDESFIYPDSLEETNLAMSVLKGAAKQATKPGKPEHKMEGKRILEAVETTLSPFAIQEAEYLVEKAKREAEIKTNILIDKIMNPDNLINESVKKYLSQP